MKHHGKWIGETVLTRVGDDIAPARVIATDRSDPPIVLAVIDTENVTARATLVPAPLSEIVELQEGTYVTRTRAIWPDEDT